MRGLASRHYIVDRQSTATSSTSDREEAAGLVQLAWPVLLAFAVAADVVGRGSLSYAVTLNAFIAALPLAFAFRQKQHFSFSDPALWFGTAFGLLFVAQPIYAWSSGLYRLGFLGYGFFSGEPKALSIAGIGACAFYLGFYAQNCKGTHKRSRRGRASTQDPEQVVLNGNAIIIYAVPLAIVAMLAYSLYVLHSGGVDFLLTSLSGRSALLNSAKISSSGYLYNAPLVLQAPGFLILATASKWMSPRGLLGFSLVFLGVLPFIGPGDRIVLLPVVLAVYLLRLQRTRKRPNPFSVLAVMLVIFILVVTLPRLYRGQSAASQSAGATVTDALSPTQFFNKSLGGLDMAMSDALSIEAARVPAMTPYMYGATYVGDLTKPIPRKWWAGKPVTADQTLNAIFFPGTASAGVGFAFSIFGEPWFDGSWLGVALVLLLFGAAWGRFDALRRTRPSIVTTTAFAVSLPFIIVFMRGGIGEDYQDLLLVLLPLLWIGRHARSYPSSQWRSPSRSGPGFSTAPRARPAPPARARERYVQKQANPPPESIPVGQKLWRSIEPEESLPWRSAGK